MILEIYSKITLLTGSKLHMNWRSDDFANKQYIIKSDKFINVLQNNLSSSDSSTVCSSTNV